MADPVVAADTSCECAATDCGSPGILPSQVAAQLQSSRIRSSATHASPAKSAGRRRARKWTTRNEHHGCESMCLLDLAPQYKTAATKSAVEPVSLRHPHPLSVFVAVLGYSRTAYVQFVTDERLETLMACHEAAFAFVGGTPHEVLYDNMRTVVIGRSVWPGQAPAAARVPRLCPSPRLSAPAMPPLPGADHGQGRALYSLPAPQFLGSAGQPVARTRSQGGRGDGQR